MSSTIFMKFERTKCQFENGTFSEELKLNKETKTSFVNRTLGLSLGATQGMYSCCSDAKRQVLFSLNVPNGDIILSPNWSTNSYARSIKHIKKISDEGYELLVFRVWTKKNSKGETRTVGFDPVTEKRKLIDVDGKTFRAVPLDYEEESEPSNNTRAQRKNQTIDRIIRDTKISKKIKNLYQNSCQVCGVKLVTPSGDYSEGAHIIPLGAPHHGPDKESNILCLCPNHHVLLDKFSITFASDGQVSGNEDHRMTLLHDISETSIIWHNTMYLNAKKVE